MKEIHITDFENLKIGQVENKEKGTGCSVFICKEGMCAGLDVRGGGPASRESELLKPLANADCINAIVLAGGSAFGLDAAGGVMEVLEKNNIGYDVGVTKVPLVCQSDLFDLTVGDPFTRPDKEMGIKACQIALDGGNYRDGNYGAGCGATVGKIHGMETCMKTGIGSYAVSIGELKVGAVVALNALGDVYDYATGKKVAGLLNSNHSAFEDSETCMFEIMEAMQNKFVGNTTIGIVFTNAKFNKSELSKIAGMTHDGYARSIRPVHTSADGDSIYAVSLGNINADKDMIGTLAANVMSQAILNAVYSADSAYGCIAKKDLKF